VRAQAVRRSPFVVTQRITKIIMDTGTVIKNRYRIVRKLGQGGFGAVYRAWDLNLRRPCALKENLTISPAAQEQFTREAWTLGNLHHPNLPRVIDYFSIPEQGQYLVMDFIDGEDLSTLLQREGSIPQKQAIAWVSQIADALTYLHKQSPPVFHRDIKPVNIRLTSQGRAVLVDFGLVKVADPDIQTMIGARGVTPGYGPPEQYGKGNTDARTDIYALGATLYALLTNQDPQESVRRILNEELVLASDVNATVSSSVSRVVAKAMQLEQAERYQSAEAFKAALEAAISTPIPPPPPPEEGDTLIVGQSPFVPPLPKEVIPPSNPPFYQQPPPLEATAPVPQPPPSYKPTMVAAPPPQVEQQTPPPPPKKRSRFFWIALGFVAVLALCACVALAIAIPAINNAMQEISATSTAEAEATNLAVAQAASSAKAIPSMTAQAEATASAAAEERATAEANATASADAAANIQATADAQATEAAAGAEQAATPEAQATPNAQVAEELNNLEANSIIVFGPEGGSLPHDSDEFLESTSASVSLQNLIVEATFVNPYDVSVNAWDYGFIFRQGESNEEYRLIIRSEERWELNNRITDDDNKIEQGQLFNLKLNGGESNTVKFIAEDQRGFLFVNDELIAQVLLSDRIDAGDVELVTAFYGETEIEGEATAYEGFTISAIGNLLSGPTSGSLLHEVDDGLISTSLANVSLIDFIAEATIINPYPLSVANWDVGFLFRNIPDQSQYFLVIFSDSSWRLGYYDGNEDSIISEGEIANLDVSLTLRASIGSGHCGRGK
jgi:serine/threonine-protein kinase